jgi:hypothetical protein
VDVLFDDIEHEIARLPDEQQHVTVVDWRRCPVMAPEAAARIAGRIAGMNARTERSAALANSNAPVAVLQFLRVIREAGLPDRKLFYDGLQMRRWVAEILTAAEAARLADFIDESEA